MKKNTINIRNVYNINGQVFNVGEDGTKTRFDKTFNKKYGYGSADNIKHCLKEAFSEIIGEPTPTSYFGKNIKNSDKKESQDSVFTTFDLRNPFIRLMGVWNPNDVEFGKGKYNKCSLTSIVRISDMLPLHTLLVSMDKQCGVRCGNANDKVFFKDGKTTYYSIDELVHGAKKTVEEAERMFRETRAMNFYEKNETSSGIYYVDYHIDVNNIRYVDITNVSLSDEERQSYINDGYQFEIKNGKEYFIVPVEQALCDFNALVDSLFEWDYMSNNTVHGSVKQLLRSTISLNNTGVWQQTTIATLNEDGKSASLDFPSKEEEIESGVFSFNTKALKQFYNNDNIDYGIISDKLAIEKIKEIGYEILSNI